MNDNTKMNIAAVVSAAGALAAGLKAAFDGDPSTVANWETIFLSASIVAGAVGLYFGRGKKVSDEQAGAGKQ